ncbi:uncharacterized protein LOC141848770 [Brevipalpus obovatus]|uniref:uncharacterized protein LOC141848770 n=1 Tax=Brevipalpus obovatus TaxID=246614 RepID=UPI003D9F16FB
MGPKIVFSCLLLASLVLSSLAYNDYYYNITITTSPVSQAKFDSQEGNLKIKLRGINMQLVDGVQDFTLTSTPVALKNGASWSFPIQTEIAFERLQAIELRWTLKSPFNPMYLVSKPKIFFEPILTSISYIEFGVKRQVFKQFCAERIPQAIEHSETKLFRPCPIYI